MLASISVGNQRDLKFPPTIQDLIIALDNDTAKEAIRDRDLAIERFVRMGMNVRTAFSPVGKDANDLMNYEGASS